MAANSDPTIPSFIVDTETKIDLVIEKTEAQVAEQGYTYNQAGFTYNQPGVMYGGVYNVNRDDAPVFANDTAGFVTPSISAIIDAGSHPVTPPGPNNQKIVGPGWWMYVSQ